MTCFFCGQPTTEDRYCESCTTYICDNCGKNSPKRKGHDVHMHLPKSRRPNSGNT